MAHSRSFRTLLLLWALWFTASLSEAGGLHTCPVHGGGDGSMAGHAAIGGHEAASAPAAHHEHASSSGPENSQGGHQACTCLGLCCCTGPMAVAIPEQGIEVATLPRAPDTHYPEPRLVDIERPYALPYANGPPTRV